MNTRPINEDIYYISDDTSKSPFYVTIAGISYPDPSYYISRKNSQVITVEYIMEGSGTVEFNGKVFHPEKGDVYIIPPKHDHIYYSDPSQPWKKIWFNASGPLVDAVVSSYGLNDTNLIKDSGTLNYFERIVAICSDISSKSEINEKVALIFHELIQTLSRQISDLCPMYSNEVSKMKNYIDTHISENVTTEKLASIIFKSKSQATRIFKAEMNTTPYDYLLERRFAQAKSLLQSTNLLIKEIAYRCGFTDEHYFSDIFKRKCGTTPGEYRNNIK